ncbi:MAG: hypothetical protein H6579_04415 [Chitinophagales bacterium]|nr:hypothetical protein [Bacteroidota bacterium]MCB9256353.1 hypothetical protein [Chitinophagales bacterium]
MQNLSFFTSSFGFLNFYPFTHSPISFKGIREAPQGSVVMFIPVGLLPLEAIGLGLILGGWVVQ